VSLVALGFATAVLAAQEVIAYADHRLAVDDHRFLALAFLGAVALVLVVLFGVERHSGLERRTAARESPPP
jgi:hypothetical protein